MLQQLAMMEKVVHSLDIKTERILYRKHSLLLKPTIKMIKIRRYFL